MPLIEQFEVVSDGDDVGIFIHRDYFKEPVNINGVSWVGGTLIINDDRQDYPLLNSGESDILSAARRVTLILVSITDGGSSESLEMGTYQVKLS